MNQAWLHLMTNHIPVLGLPIAAMALVWGVVRRHDAVIRLALFGTVLLGPLTALVAWSGDGAEHVIEDTPWASRTRIHNHEEAGDNARVAALVAAAGALVVLVMARRREISRGGTIAVLVAAIVASGTAGYAAFEGGEIRHDEVHGFAPDAGQPRPPRQQ
ncbi:MAG: hypothetical protein ABIR59_01035 [Gemmatimonadales bacterium]